MLNFDLVAANLLSPAVICFALGAFAALVKSDLRVPPQVHETISMYLLFSIGLKGGIALDHSADASMLWPLMATIFMGLLTPVVAFIVARNLGRQSIVDSGAMAAHFGSVSAVTFMAALNFATLSGFKFEGYLTALLIVLEVPGIIIGIVLARTMSENRAISVSHVLREAITSKSVMLMGGGLLVGLLTDAKGIEAVSTVFITPFQGVLAFFLLELGVVALTRLRESRAPVPFMLAFGISMPILFGAIGLMVGHFAGLSVGGTAIFATMAASASYIAAPAAVRMAMPEANEGLYLTTAISITLPFNIIIGIPAYFAVSAMIGGWPTMASLMS
jgi:hypothetical protein